MMGRLVTKETFWTSDLALQDSGSTRQQVGLQDLNLQENRRKPPQLRIRAKILPKRTKPPMSNAGPQICPKVRAGSQPPLKAQF
jgi:hypothetical protein